MGTLGRQAAICRKGLLSCYLGTSTTNFPSTQEPHLGWASSFALMEQHEAPGSAGVHWLTRSWTHSLCSSFISHLYQPYQASLEFHGQEHGAPPPLEGGASRNLGRKSPKNMRHGRPQAAHSQTQWVTECRASKTPRLRPRCWHFFDSPGIILCIEGLSKINSLPNSTVRASFGVHRFP